MIYMPGNEPEELKKYLNVLLKELHEAFPDNLIVMDMWNHERWDKLAGFLVQKLGYPNGRSFLNAYGFDVFDGSEVKASVQKQSEPQRAVYNDYSDSDKRPQAELPRTRVTEPSYPTIRQEIVIQTQDSQSQKRIRCPHCGSTDIKIDTFQEELGSTTKSKTKFKFKQVGHGFLWWLFIGWWWWIIDLMIWIVFFPFRLLFQIFRRKKYKGKATTISQSKNEIAYKKVYTCQSCGHSWKRGA